MPTETTKTTTTTGTTRTIRVHLDDALDRRIRMHAGDLGLTVQEAIIAILYLHLPQYERVANCAADVPATAMVDQRTPHGADPVAEQAGAVVVPDALLVAAGMTAATVDG